jgi:hypothetical protein
MPAASSATVRAGAMLIDATDTNMTFRLVGQDERIVEGYALLKNQTREKTTRLPQESA